MSEKVIIYEKDSKLNLILTEQISDSRNYEVFSITNQIKLIETIKKKQINALILNLDDLNDETLKVIKNNTNQKNINHILGYCDRDYCDAQINNIIGAILIKPFKIIQLLIKLDKLLSTKNFFTSDIFLMSNLKFLPYEKVLINLNTKNKEHLTEKENKLLLYFCNNKNIELTKNDLLSSIWGVSENLNTHTLETHIYRLKLKLNKLEPSSSFLLSNNNGLYSFQF